MVCGARWRAEDADIIEGDLEDTRAAYTAGDHEKEFRLLKPLAEQGNSEAQMVLGVMHEKGEGVAEDDAKAVYWYRKAAEQGDDGAQQALGEMYLKGEGVPQNLVKAYAWMNIATAQAHEILMKPILEKYKSFVEKRMTPEQIAKGQELAAEYWEKYVVPFQKD